jgi:chorismate-pyruvate lyase
VRIDLGLLDAATVAAILAAKIPLGRILIEANLLRDVHDVGLLEVVPGPHLRRLFGPAAAATPRTFGRVAEISLGGRPAIELLEIAAPGLLPKTLR